MTNFLLIVAAIAIVGVVFEIVKESIQARKKSSDNGDNPTEGTSTEESKIESVFKTIQYTSTPTPTPEFKENSKSTTADYLSYAGTTVNNEVKVVDEKKRSGNSKEKESI